MTAKATRVLQRHSDFRALLSTAEPCKGPKMAKNRLNATWNTTRCKAAGFSRCLLPKRPNPLLVVLNKGP